MNALIPEGYTPARSERDLTYEQHGPIIKRILFEHGHAMPIKDLVQVMVDLGLIVLQPKSTLHLYPTHPYRARLSEIVRRLYVDGELEGLGGEQPSETKDARTRDQ